MRKSRLTWALAAIPLVGVIEAELHVKETTREVVPDSDWMAARDAVKGDFRPTDLVLFAPFWADPIGRQFFGDQLAGVKRQARPDETRYARVFEVSIRGKHRPEIDHWKLVAERKVGLITIGTYENPAPVTLHTDLLDLVGPERMSVSRAEGNGEVVCSWQRGAGQPGGLSVPQGPAIPGDKFSCTSGYVGAAVLHALDHHPHLCIFVSPPSGRGVTRIRFSEVLFGESLHGHDGVQWVTERTGVGESALVAFSAFGRPIGQHAHRAGSGWVGYEFPTPELAGQRGDLLVEVSGAGQRSFCFEADTRSAAPGVR